MKNKEAIPTPPFANATEQTNMADHLRAECIRLRAMLGEKATDPAD